MIYFLKLALALAACFAAQKAAIHALGGPSTKSESNYFSSIARIQESASAPAHVLLLGSSLTGRLPDRGDGFASVANLGCDGGSAVDTLRALDRGLIPAAPILVIEGNTLFKAQAGQTSGVGEAMSKPWFKAGLQFPAVAAGARPSGLAYTTIRSRKFGRAEGPDGPSLPVQPSPSILTEPVSLNNDDQRELLKELAQITNRLTARGHRLLLIILPPGAPPDSPNQKIPRAWAQMSAVPLIDLTEGLPPGSLSYTDGIHLAPASAAATLRSIMEAVDQLPATAR
jgi:hypothetical protein